MAKFGQALIGIFVVKLTTTYLGQTGDTVAYGQYTAIYEYLAYFGIIADLGLYTIAVKEMSKDEDQIPKILGNILSLRLFLVVVTMSVAALLVFQIPQYNYAASRIPIGAAIASLSVFFYILNGTITSVLQTKYQMGRASLSLVLGRALGLIYMAYIVFYLYPNDIESGFNHLIIAGVCGAIFTFFLSSYYVRKVTPITLRFDIDLWKRILKESLPYGIALILNTVYFRIDSLIILFMRGEGELGIYAPAMKLLEQFTILPLYFMNSILPILTKAIKENKERAQIIIRHSFDVLAALAVPIVVGGFILAYPIVFVISTPEFLSRISEGFYGTDIALSILIFALIFQFLNTLFAFILISVDQQKKLLYISAACVLFNLVGNLLFIPTYGFRAAAVTSVLSELFILLGNYYLAKRHFDFTIPLKNFGKIVISAIIMGVVVHSLEDITYQYLQNWNVIILVAVGVAVYTYMIFATKTITKEKIKLILKKQS